MEEKEIGRITHYFSHISVAVVELTAPLKVGDKLHIKGATTDFTQTAESMQIEHKPVQSAKKGDSIGMKVNSLVRPGDKVYKI